MSAQHPTETSATMWGERYTPPSVIAETAKALASSGVVDQLHISDQLMNFIPPELWSPENTPMTEHMPDPDSHADPVAVLTYAIAHAPELGVTMMTDSVRRNPAEMIQTMLTLANLTAGRAQFMIGGGEIKQAKPFGLKRSHGLDRMEDLFKLFHLVMDNDGPIDFEGKKSSWKRGFLGAAKPHRPQLWALGSGPRLVDLAAAYCDGLCVGTPLVWADPEIAAADIQRIRDIVESKGRDPDKFRFGIGCPTMIHDDPNVFDKAFDNPLVRWLACVMGRINGADWKRDGLDSPVPDDWTYYQKLLPFDMPPGFVSDALAKTTREHCERGLIWGTPEKVAKDLQAYVDVGVSWVLPLDYLPVVLDPADAANSAARMIEVCRRLKEAVPAA